MRSMWASFLMPWPMPMRSMLCCVRVHHDGAHTSLDLARAWHSKGAWLVAQTQMDACFVHAVLPACHAMPFLVRAMQHGMQHACVAGAQDPEIGPTRSSRLTCV